MADHGRVVAGSGTCQETLFAHRIVGERVKGPAWHWTIAVLLHVPIVYLLLAITITDTDLERGDSPQVAAEAVPAPIVLNDALPAAAPFVIVVSPGRQLPALPQSQTPSSTRPFAESISQPTPGPGSAVERMTPPVMADRRLLNRPDSSKHVAPVDRVRARIAESLTPINDSIVAEQRAKQRADDMTVTDRNGNRWGMTRGALHLGERTLRLAKATAGGHVPDLIVASPGKRDEVNALKRNWLEIELQSSRALIKGVFDQRASDMRQRNDSARINAVANGAASQTRRR